MSTHPNFPSTRRPAIVPECCLLQATLLTFAKYHQWNRIYSTMLTSLLGSWDHVFPCSREWSPMNHSGSWLLRENTTLNYWSKDIWLENPFRIHESACLPIMQINCLPIRIISRIECTPIDKKFVTKYELHFLTCGITRYCVNVVWRIKVYQSPIPGHAGNLDDIIKALYTEKRETPTWPDPLIPPRLNPPRFEGLRAVKCEIRGYPALRKSQQSLDSRDAQRTRGWRVLHI